MLSGSKLLGQGIVYKRSKMNRQMTLFYSNVSRRRVGYLSHPSRIHLQFVTFIADAGLVYNYIRPIGGLR